MPPRWSTGAVDELSALPTAGTDRSHIRSNRRVPGPSIGSHDKFSWGLGLGAMADSGALDSKQRAFTLITDFERGRWPGVFKHITARELARNLRQRVHAPSTIDQGVSSLCGPAALVYRLASMDPAAYVTFVVELYLFGKSRLGTLQIVAGSDLRNYRLQSRDALAPADWIALASIRDSENWLLDYDSPRDLAPGMTLPFELAAWFKKMGFRTVLNETRVVRESDAANLRRASALHESDHWVCLLVHQHILDTTADERRKPSLFPSHWIVLRDRVHFDDGYVSLAVYSWGIERRRIPYEGGTRTLRIGEFLDHYYGFVAAKG
jgi:hypothetical protein